MNNNFVSRTTCEVCGSSNRHILKSVPLTDESVWNFLESYYENKICKELVRDTKYEISLCDECGFAWQTYVLNEDMMTELYENIISKEHSLNKKKYADIHTFIKYAEEISLISYVINKNPYETNVLDFGMGWGYWCRMAMAFGFNVTGYDISLPRIEYAKCMNINVIESFNKIENSTYDFINTEQVFEHITQPLDTLMKLSKALKNKGVIRISVPNAEYALRTLNKNGWKASKDALHPLEHINCYTHKSLKYLGTIAGLEFVRRPWPIITPSRGKTMLNILRILAAKNITRGTALYFRKK